MSSFVAVAAALSSSSTAPAAIPAFASSTKRRRAAGLPPNSSSRVSVSGWRELTMRETRRRSAVASAPSAVRSSSAIWSR